MKTSTCKGCGESFSWKPHGERERSFCSLKCFSQWRGREKRRIAALRTEKACSVCGSVKPVEEFARSKHHLDGRTSACKPCRNEQTCGGYAVHGRRHFPPNREVTHKKCSVCQSMKPASEFPKDGQKTDGYGSMCTLCNREHAKRHRLKHRDRLNALQREKFKSEYPVLQYALPRSQYEAWVAEKLKEQDWLCPICLSLFSEDCKPCVDHCHATNKLRGLLCTRCNTGIGFLRDDPGNVARAAEYLLRHKELGLLRWCHVRGSLSRGGLR